MELPGAANSLDTDRGPAQVRVRRERQGIALCLSGGGFRAALFHVGALRRLNELGVLSKVDTFSCVSGGSIIGAYLALAFHRGLAAKDGVFSGFDALLDQFVPFTQQDIRTRPFLAQLHISDRRSGKAPRRLQKYYEELTHGMKLSELPAHPRFVFCATDLFFANSWICERERIGDYRTGYVSPPPADWTVGKAVAASSCFPPIFDPLSVDIPPEQYSDPKDPETGESLSDVDLEQLDRARRKVQLTDGGVYDNLGLEPVWKFHETVLVSDGGKPLQHKYVPPGRRVLLYSDIIQNQVGALRKRWLIDTYQRAKRGVDPDTFTGAYWGIMSATRSYNRRVDHGYSKGLAARIANIRTDLDRFSPNETAVLGKHGYELAGMAIATHVPSLAHHPNVPRRDWPDRLANEREVAKAIEGSESRVLLRIFSGRENNLVLGAG